MPIQNTCLSQTSIEQYHSSTNRQKHPTDFDAVFLIDKVVMDECLYQNYLAMKNTADLKGGKPIAVLLQSISGVNAINSLVAFYDIHGRERGFFFFLSRTPNEKNKHYYYCSLVVDTTWTSVSCPASRVSCWASWGAGLGDSTCCLTGTMSQVRTLPLSFSVCLFMSFGTRVFVIYLLSRNLLFSYLCIDFFTYTP
jgi:hypothetical protein